MSNSRDREWLLAEGLRATRKEAAKLRAELERTRRELWDARQALNGVAKSLTARRCHTGATRA